MRGREEDEDVGDNHHDDDDEGRKGVGARDRAGGGRQRWMERGWVHGLPGGCGCSRAVQFVHFNLPSCTFRCEARACTKSALTATLVAAAAVAAAGQEQRDRELRRR